MVVLKTTPVAVVPARLKVRSEGRGKQEDHSHEEERSTPQGLMVGEEGLRLSCYDASRALSLCWRV